MYQKLPHANSANRPPFLYPEASFDHGRKLKLANGTRPRGYPPRSKIPLNVSLGNHETVGRETQAAHRVLLTRALPASARGVFLHRWWVNTMEVPEYGPTGTS